MSVSQKRERRVLSVEKKFSRKRKLKRGERKKEILSLRSSVEAEGPVFSIRIT